MYNNWSLSKRASLIEQTGMLILIVGRWLIPKGMPIPDNKLIYIAKIVISTSKPFMST